MSLREAYSRSRDPLAGGSGEPYALRHHPSCLPVPMATTRPSDVGIWHGRMDLPDEQVQCLRSLLSTTERERAQGFGQASLARRFVVRRGLLRRLLGVSSDVEFECVNGKPYLAGSPLGFNVSHRGEHFLMGLAEAVQVGVDLERIPSHWSPEEGLLRDNFAPSERALIAQDPALFWKAWTRKEACIKALGVGLSAPLPSFVVLREDALGSVCDFEFEGGLVVSDLDLPKPLVGAVCWKART